MTWHLLELRGLDWDLEIDGQPGATVKDLLTELYVNVGATRQWALIRYISGILKKKVEALDEVRTGHRGRALIPGLACEKRQRMGKSMPDFTNTSEKQLTRKSPPHLERTLSSGEVATEMPDCHSYCLPTSWQVQRSLRFLRCHRDVLIYALT